jgi:transmembrane sensor
MSDFTERLRNLKPTIDVDWNESRQQQTHQAILRRQQRAAQHRRIVGSTLTVAALVVVGGLVSRQMNSNIKSLAVYQDVPGAADAGSVKSARSTFLELSDGTKVSWTDPTTEVVPVEQGPDRVIVRLQHGTARFDVSHHPERVFRVVARSADISVLGTSFTVSLQSKQTHVVVHEGSVRVVWPGSSNVLIANQHIDCPVGISNNPGQGNLLRVVPSKGVPSAIVPGKSHPNLGIPNRSPTLPVPPATVGGQRKVPAPPSVEAVSTPEQPVASSWQELGRKRKFASAYQQWKVHGFAIADLGPAELLLAADVARMSRHPSRAIAPLQQIVSRFPSDSRAPLAAFTLGRMWIDELGNPGKAAQAFAQAHRLSPSGPLAQDSLAREIEALFASGAKAAARTKAKQYLVSYPKGSRRARVEAIANSEP